MLSPTQHKIIHGLVVICIFITIVEPHLVFELIVEGLDLLFEGIESALDHLIELIFETGSHTTQIIVFYIMFTAAGYGVYRIWRALPIFWQAIKDYFSATYLGYKTEFLIYWLKLSLFGKIKFVAFSLAGCYLMILLFF